MLGVCCVSKSVDAVNRSTLCNNQKGVAQQKNITPDTAKNTVQGCVHHNTLLSSRRQQTAGWLLVRHKKAFEARLAAEDDTLWLSWQDWGIASAQVRLRCWHNLMWQVTCQRCDAHRPLPGSPGQLSGGSQQHRTLHASS